MEYGFDTLPGGPTWDVIAANSFNLFASRWNTDSTTCNGGLKWQYNPEANGWTVSLSHMSYFANDSCFLYLSLKRGLDLGFTNLRPYLSTQLPLRC
jgi:hypothetical protein